MKARSQNSCCIGHRADKSGRCSSVRNQAEVEKCASGTKLPKNSLKGHQNCVKANSEKSSNKNDLKLKKWARREYREIMEGYYCIKYHPSDESNTKQTYKIWRERNLNNRQYIDVNKLANVRRQIVRDKRLSDIELSQIEDAAKNVRPERNVEPVTRVENFDNEEIEEMINRIRNGENIIKQEKQADKVEQVNYELEPETKELKEEILRKIHQIKHMRVEEREKLCKMRSDKRARILINRTKLATKEILRVCEETLENINKVIYAEAYVVTEKLNGEPKKYTNRRTNKKPRWKEKTEKEMNELRGKVSILDELLRGVKVKSRILNRMKKKYKMKNFEDLAPLKETLKQKIQLKAQIMRRYDKRSKFCRHSNTFKMDEKKFYRELGKTQVTVEKPPYKEEAEKFWTSI